MTEDFTLAAFAQFTRQLACQRVLTVSQYVRTVPCTPFIVLRFDVDFREPFALRLAAILAHYGVRGTFYFRRHTTGFEWDAIHAIAALGHETGYHYETLDRCRGDYQDASDQFLEDVIALRAGGVQVETVAAHGAPPLASTYTSNLDLLRVIPSLLNEADLRGDAVASVVFARLDYFSDAGWRWRHCTGTPPGTSAAASSLAELRAELAQPNAALYVNIHPHQWYARSSSLRYFRARNRLGMQIVPRLAGLRDTLPGNQARHE